MCEFKSMLSSETLNHAITELADYQTRKRLLLFRIDFSNSLFVDFGANFGANMLPILIHFDFGLMGSWSV